MSASQSRRILIVATDGFEQSELIGPRDAFLAAGLTVDIASIEPGAIQGMVHDKKGETVEATLAVADIEAGDYDALVLPGGVANPDTLRMNEEAVQLVREFMAAGKPVAAICHGPWLLAEADVIRNRRVTSWPSIRTDLRNAGAEVVDEEVTIDGNLITSRKPDDVPAFSRAVIDVVSAADRRRSAA
ncbi:MAG: type 1 glutamine amidotransferase domain-containing protein [Sphingomonadaceae bacterium]|nr:type 1 glutamine amidotransferase domain-containing protein [Sphingomonadaceae bacterium]